MMLANLQPGDCISYIGVKHGKPVEVQVEVTQIEKKANFGRVWTHQGAFSWQPLTAKYEVVSRQLQAG
jgi:hypothetical protein